MNNWTNEPGVAMEKSDDYKDYGCDYKIQIELKDEFDILSFCFTNGNNVWDNGKVTIDSSYFVCEGTYLVSDLTLYVVECKGLDYKYEESKLKIYYSGFDVPYVHYAAEQGAWTELPGDKLSKTPVNEHVSKAFPYRYDITVGGAGVVAAVFNDNNGNWEKYGSGNFSFYEGTYLFQNKTYTRLLPIEKFPAAQ